MQMRFIALLVERGWETKVSADSPALFWGKVGRDFCHRPSEGCVRLGPSATHLKRDACMISDAKKKSDFLQKRLGRFLSSD